MLIERSEGNLERYLVTGISEIELLVAHGSSQIAALVYVIASNMIATFVIYAMTCKGSYVLAMILQLLVSFCGMCFGRYI